MRLKRFDREFFKLVLAVAGPVLVQNVITNFVNLLDNIMVGQIGTESMSGVAIVNQLLFVFNLCIFGGLAGPGIFTAQYCGKGDMEGVRSTVRIKLFIAAGAVAVFAAALLMKGGDLISLFLHEGQDTLDLSATLRHGQAYLRVMIWQMLPFALMQVYSSSLRETGETLLPMKAGIAAVLVNLCLNWVLIFGKLGAPALGVVGAAIATLIARIVECAIVLIWSHRHLARAPFVPGLYKTLHVPGKLFRQVAVMGAPLLANEVLWSTGMTMLNQCYSVRGLEVVSATNISSTVSNLFFCAFFAIGNTISILVGHYLGAGELERAVDEDRKLISFAFALSMVLSAVMAATAPFFPLIYNTIPYVRELATKILLVSSLMMPMHAFANSCYFTLRSGGKTLITFIFDSGSLWLISVPAAFVIAHYTAIPIVPFFAIVEGLNLIKCVIGYVMVKQQRWVVNLVGSKG